MKPNLINNKVLFENGNDYVPSSNRVANWKLDNNILDSSSNLWVGSYCTGIEEYGSGVDNQSIHVYPGVYLGFKGDYTPTQKDLNFRNYLRINKNNFSISFWFKIDNIESNNIFIYTNDFYIDDSTLYIYYGYKQPSSPHLEFYLNGNVYRISYNILLEKDRWYFIICQYNNQTGFQELYLDCRLLSHQNIGTNLITGYIFYNNTISGDINYPENNSYWLDDIWIIRDVWTEEQMIDYYNNFKNRKIIGT